MNRGLAGWSMPYSTRIANSHSLPSVPKKMKAGELRLCSDSSLKWSQSLYEYIFLLLIFFCFNSSNISPKCHSVYYIHITNEWNEKYPFRSDNIKNPPVPLPLTTSL